MARLATDWRHQREMEFSEELLSGSAYLHIFCELFPGDFNPNSEDPLMSQMKKQLVLRIISGQQLPKPRDSMLGDRGEV